MDITSLVYSRSPVSITYGQTDESSVANTGSCTFLINNRDGRFSPRNPLSPLFGKIGRNTQCRVSVPDGFTQNVRFWGEITTWPQNWDTTGLDVWVEVQASGILRRLSQAAVALRSTLYQGLTSATLLSVNPPVSYWPCEDSAGATQIASGNGGRAMQITGSPTLADYSGLASSSPLPTMGNGSFSGSVPVYSHTGSTQIRFALFIPSTGTPANDSHVMHVYLNGTIKRVELHFLTVSGGAFSLQAYDASDTKVGDSGGLAFGTTGNVQYFDLELIETGGNVNFSMFTYIPNAPTGTLFFNALLSTGQTTGNVTRIVMAPNGDQNGIAVGHITLQRLLSSPFDELNQINAFTGEKAGNRAVRLLQDSGVNVGIVGTPSDSVPMGPELPGNVTDLIADAILADDGSLYERWTAFGLGVRMRTGMYNVPVQATLDYAAGNLSAIPIPLDDDRFTKNDITVTRVNGSYSRSTLTSGALSINPPPLGVGPYSDSLTLNIQSDTTLDDQAGWRLHRGTVDLPRFPSVTVDLAHPSFSPVTAPGLRSSVVNLRPGERLNIVNPPIWVSPDTLDLLVVGGSETIDQFQHILTFTCTPYAPFVVALADDDTAVNGVFARADTDGSTLASDLTPTGTSFFVTTTDPNTPPWEVGLSGVPIIGQVPFDIMVGGERITVRFDPSSGNPQQFVAVVRHVNGIVKAHRAGEDVRLAVPSIVAL